MSKAGRPAPRGPPRNDSGDPLDSSPPIRDTYSRDLLRSALPGGALSQIRAAEALARTGFGLWDVPDSRYPVFLIDPSHWTGLVNRELDQTGLTVERCALLLKEGGAWAGVNMDGGSSTLVIEENSEPLVLNVPTNDTGRKFVERETR